jgi:microcystin-dependent protein
MLCQGQILSVPQYTALFAVVGASYGGNGTTTFALPDLRGRVPIGSGQGTGLSSYKLGGAGGVETVTLSMSQMPAHNHSFNAGSLPPSLVSTPIGNVMGKSANQIYNNTTPVQADAQLSPLALPSMGGGLPHENRMPTVTLNWIIAIQGIFPPRS